MTDKKKAARKDELWLCDLIGDAEQGADAASIDKGANSAALESLRASGAVKIEVDGQGRARYWLTSLGQEFATAHRRRST